MVDKIALNAKFGKLGSQPMTLVPLSVIEYLTELEMLAARVARLNPDVGEIGPGMLASLVEQARRLVGVPQ